MQHIYSTIENSKIGCFESPTGTGKSLSTICASLTWLKEEEDKRIAETRPPLGSSTDYQDKVETVCKDNDFEDWLSGQIKATNENKSKKSIDTSHYEYILQKIQRSVLPEIKTTNKNEVFHLSGKNNSKKENNNNTENNTIPTSIMKDAFTENIEYAEDEEDHIKEQDPEAEATTTTPNDPTWQELQLPQIFYTSRTHSQLTQFIQEIQKTKFANMRTVILGSRKQLCIHPQIHSLKQEWMINDACLQATTTTNSTSSMEKKEKTEMNTEPAIKRKKITNNNKSNSSSLSSLKNTFSPCSYKHFFQEEKLAFYSLQKVQDIEEIHQLGEQFHACPYYASKQSLPYAQLIALPYNMLFQREIRKAYQISLQNAIVIIDEAHNIVDMMTQIHSWEITSHEFQQLSTVMKYYVTTYQTKLSGESIYQWNVIILLIKKILRVGRDQQQQQKLKLKTVENSSIAVVVPPTKTFTTTSPTTRNATTNSVGHMTMTINEFLMMTMLDHVNCFAMIKFLQKPKLIEKIIHIYLSSLTISNSNHQNTTSTAGDDASFAMMVDLKSIFYKFIELLQCLTNRVEDGRLFFIFSSFDTTNKVKSTSKDYHYEEEITSIFTLKYQQLDATNVFQEVLTQARSVILLGGTMQPFSYFTSTILQKIPMERLVMLSCQHVVPSHHIFPCIISHLPTSSSSSTSTTSNGGRNSTHMIPIELTYDKRQQPYIIQGLGQIMLTLWPYIPNGIVIFFTSYSYLENVITAWKVSGLYQQLHAIKPIYTESKIQQKNNNVSIVVETIWQQYSNDALHHDQGAVLLSVIGGRLSEGINFSDQLARSVMIIGMPFPDQRDICLMEKIRYANQQDVSIGQSLPELLCMRAVNQAIGRAIRHRLDYASIFLIDYRYQQLRVIQQLPTWIRQSFPSSLSSPTSISWPEIIQQCQLFYAQHASTTTTI
jgi:chromosome transmission fidelity protein 1